MKKIVNRFVKSKTPSKNFYGRSFLVTKENDRFFTFAGEERVNWSNKTNWTNKTNGTNRT